MSQAKTAATTTSPLARAVSSRRSLFGGAAAVVLGGGITAGVAASVADFTETPDAELIRLCAEFDVLERQRQHVANSAKTTEEEGVADQTWAEISLRQNPMLDRICSLPCVTLAGLGAIAATLALWDCDELCIAEDDPDAPANDRLTAALLRSALTGRA